MARTTEEIYRELIAQAQGQGSQTPKTNDNILQYASKYNPDAQTGSNAGGASEDYYRELMNQGRAAQERANSYLSQYDSRGPFRYDANNDPVYQSLRDQYVHQGKRAMADTMGQAAGLTGGYASTYGQSVGNQAYNEYLTKLSAQIPGLAANARAAYDADGDRLLNRYNLELNAAGTAYNQARDALGDLRYEREYADNQAYQQWQREQAEQQAAWDREYQQWQMGHANQGDAYNHAMTLIQTGHMPSAEALTAAGISAEDAQWLVEYYSQLLANQNSGGGSGGGGGYYSYGGNDDDTSGGGGGDATAKPTYNGVRDSLHAAAQMGDMGRAYEIMDQLSSYGFTAAQIEDLTAYFAQLFGQKPEQQRHGSNRETHGPAGTWTREKY